jgi:hypothetical protein
MSNEQQDRWRREFEQSGYEAVKRTVSKTSGWDEPRRQFAFRWLTEKDNAVEHREQQVQHDTRSMRQDTRRMLWLGVAAIVISVFSLLVAFVSLLVAFVALRR